MTSTSFEPFDRSVETAPSRRMQAEHTPASIVNRRSACIVACLGCQITSGVIYLFPAYAAPLSEKLELSDTQLQLVGAMGNVGAWVGVSPGLVCDALGVRRSVALAGCVSFVGFSCMGMAYDGVMPSQTPALMAYMFFFAQGSSLAYVSSIKCGQGNFRLSERGKYVGLLTSYFGISAGAFSLLFKTLFQPYTPQLSKFMYAAATIILVVQGSSSLFLGYPAAASASDPEPPLRPAVEHTRALMLYAVTVAVVAVQFVFGLVDSQVNSQPARIGLWSMYAAGLLALPLLAAVVWRFVAVTPADVEFPTTEDEATNGTKKTAEDAQEMLVDAHPVNESSDAMTAAEEGDATKAVSDYTTHGVTLKEAVKMLDMWLLFGSLLAGLCFPVALLNNLAGVIASLSTEVAYNGEVWDSDGSRRKAYSQQVGAFVALFSCCNVVGRLVINKAAEHFRQRLPVEFFLFLACAVSAAGCALFLVWMKTEALYVVGSLAGMAIGGIFGISPLCTSRRFGLRAYGAIWGVVVFAPCLSTLGIATFTAGHFADERRKEHYFVMKGRNFCHGTACYLPTIGVALAVSVVGVAVSGLLAWRQHRAAKATAEAPEMAVAEDVSGAEADYLKSSSS